MIQQKTINQLYVTEPYGGPREKPWNWFKTTPGSQESIQGKKHNLTFISRSY